MFSSVEGVEAKFLESILFNSVNQKLRPRDSYPGRGAVGIVGDVCDAPAQCINKTVLQSHFISLTSFFFASLFGIFIQIFNSMRMIISNWRRLIYRKI